MRSCRRFEREGLLRLERGLPLGEHFDSCPECREARSAYARLLDELASLEPPNEPPGDWKAEVFRALERHDRGHWLDAASLERLRDGDAETERHFVAYWSELMRIKLRSRLRSWSLVEDVLHETFLRVLGVVRGPEGIRDPERLGPFVNSVCNNVLLEFLRAETRRGQAAAGLARPAMSPDPEITEKRKELVRRVIDKLPERDRSMLQALFLKERDKDEVCVEFGVDRDYLGVLLHRAKSLFRALYLGRQEPKARGAISGQTRRSRGRLLR